MKAIILSAGFGKRLLPYTEIIPKPLFTISNIPIIDSIIKKLEHAGFTEAIINMHHLGEKIESHLAATQYNIKIKTIYEREILGTAGSIKNVNSFLDDEPFLVINSDIITDIDLKYVFQFHLNHKYPVTMVMHNDLEFNNVEIYQNGFIKKFLKNQNNNPHTTPLNNIENEQNRKLCDGLKAYTFTGISVMNHDIMKLIPRKTFSGLIEIFEKLIASGGKIKALFCDKFYWRDIGTPKRYKNAAFESLIKSIFNTFNDKKIILIKLNGGGSDRNFYRLIKGENSIILSEDIISATPNNCQTNSFVKIGKHLYEKGVPVPKIYNYDIMSGLVFLEDIGDIHLRDIVKTETNVDNIIYLYKKVIDNLIILSLKGKEQFDTTLCYQTPSYDKELICDKECKYFLNSFLKNYLKINISYKNLADDFESLANAASDSACLGFMHRDIQSENIMIQNGKIYFIDFQAGRIGPIEYDLASLLIDPYISLTENIQKTLFKYSIDRLSSYIEFDKKKFETCFNSCFITRNLQILGAFGFLVSEKNKKWFEKYIPIAVKSLHYNIAKSDYKSIHYILQTI